MTPPLPRTTEPSPADRELPLIAARVRLLLYRQIAWHEAREADEPGWRDPWQDREARRVWSERTERGRELASSLGLTEGAIARGLPLLARIAETFTLDEHERDVLQICLAAAIAPDLAGAFSAASGRPVPTEGAIAMLLGTTGRRIVTPQSPLSRWDLVHRVELGPGEPAGLAIDPALHDWFTDNYAIDASLVSIARHVAPVEPLSRWPVTDVAARIDDRWQRGELDPHVRITVTAPSGTGRRSFAAAVARALGMNVLVLDADAVDDASWPRVVRHAHRHAFLTRTALAFVGDSLARRAPELSGGFPLVFACVEPGHVPPQTPAAVDIPVDLPAPTSDDRAALWRRAIPASTTWSADAVESLARLHRTTPADIDFAARRGVTGASDAAAAVRERTRDRLGELAQRIECSFTWSDLVLPPAVADALRDFEYEARERTRMWEQPALRRLFPHGRGLFALFAGVPGTGKTMAAQVIARGLGVDLFRISLSEVVSKYIGETAKNLQKILARAEHMDAVLLFDEADALFGKRTEIRDAHDRYANTDTNHLLQAIESYAGISILASNKRSNIDPAFLRRLRYVVEFPQPDVAERLELWRRLVGELCGAEAAVALAPVLSAFASSVELTGAQIKLAVLAALFAARRDATSLSALHLVRGVERELLKEGRSLNDRERGRLIGAH